MEFEPDKTKLLVEWFATRCSAGGEARTAELYADFRLWLDVAHPGQERFWGRRRFTNVLRACGAEAKRTAKARVIVGLSLRLTAPVITDIV